MASTGGNYIDVRDLSFALIKSLSVAEAGGERIIVCAGECYRIRFTFHAQVRLGSYYWQEWCKSSSGAIV